MELQVRNPGIDYMVERVMDFQTDDTADFWSAPLYHFYPQLNREYANSLSLEDRKKYIGRILRQAYVDQQATIDEKILRYTGHWEKHKRQIAAALSDAFEVDCNAILNDMVCNISMNPICPRFLESHTFDVFYLNSERGAIGMAIHEIIHFVWFYVWNQIFGDSYDEYEAPSLKWILSEIVVEPIMSDKRLSSINPYFPRENGGCVYPYFYTMNVGGKSVLNTLTDMFHAMTISEFMKESYAYCVVHEAEIRRHIKRSEYGR